MIRVIKGGQVSTLAGTGKAGLKNGPAASALFNTPRGIAVDGKGNVYVSDDGNHKIRLIAGGNVSTFAGSNTAGYADGPVATAKFNKPRGLQIDKYGDLYVVDSDNNRIRMISNGKVTTVAGSGAAGSINGSALTATFHYPKDITMDSAGHLYVADSYPHKIRLIKAGYVSTFAGSGAKGYLNGSAQKAVFKYPYGVVSDKKGAIYVADHQNWAIRVIKNGTVSTLAGGISKGYKDGPLKTAKFGYAVGIDVDAKGRVYLADYENNVIRLIQP